MCGRKGLLAIGERGTASNHNFFQIIVSNFHTYDKTIEPHFSKSGKYLFIHL